MMRTDGLRRREHIHHLRRNYQVTKPKSREEHCAETACKNYNARAIQSLQCRNGATRVTVFAVVIIFENCRAGTSRPFEQSQAATQRHCHAERKLMSRRHVHQSSTCWTGDDALQSSTPRHQPEQDGRSRPVPGTRAPRPDSPALPSRLDRQDLRELAPCDPTLPARPKESKPGQRCTLPRETCSGSTRQPRAADDIRELLRPKACQSDTRAAAGAAICAQSAVGKRLSAGWFARNARVGGAEPPRNGFSRRLYSEREIRRWGSCFSARTRAT